MSFDEEYFGISPEKHVGSSGRIELDSKKVDALAVELGLDSKVVFECVDSVINPKLAPPSERF